VPSYTLLLAALSSASGFPELISPLALLDPRLTFAPLDLSSLEDLESPGLAVYLHVHKFTGGEDIQNKEGNAYRWRVLCL
jgi:hypothetical protein